MENARRNSKIALYFMCGDIFIGLGYVIVIIR